MAKRSPPDEEEYRPVNEQLARSVLMHRARPLAQDSESSKEDEPPRSVPSAQPSPGSPDAKSQASPSLKVVRGKRGRTIKTSKAAEEDKKDPVRARRKEMTFERRMMLSLSENVLFDELVSGISRELRVKVNGSNVLRACLTLLNHVQGELLKQCRRMDPPQRPRYDDPTSIQVFEEHLARLFDSAVRNTKSLD